MRRIERALHGLEKFISDQDTAVIMFSGHAVQGQRGLYLLTQEAQLEGLQGTALNWQTLARSISGLQAKRTVVLLDACHSGAFSEANLRIQEEVRRQLEEKRGLLVVASSHGSEVSEELVEQEQGAFTTAVRSALRGQADSNVDRQTTVAEFAEYVTSRVAQLTNGRQHPSVVIQKLPDDEVLWATRATE